MSSIVQHKGAGKSVKGALTASTNANCCAARRVLSRPLPFGIANCRGVPGDFGGTQWTWQLASGGRTHTPELGWALPRKGWELPERLAGDRLRSARAMFLPDSPGVRAGIAGLGAA